MVLITVALQYSLKSGSMMPSTFFFFLKVVLAIQGLHVSMPILEQFYSIYMENSIGILIGTAMWIFIISLFIIEKNGNNQNEVHQINRVMCT